MAKRKITDDQGQLLKALFLEVLHERGSSLSDLRVVLGWSSDRVASVHRELVDMGMIAIRERELN